MGWWRRHAGVRVRSAVAAAGVVGLTLAVAAFSGWWLLRHSLTVAAVDAVSARSQEVAALVAEEGSGALDPDRQPVFGEVIQVIGAGDGGAARVLNAAPPSARRLSLSYAAPPADGRPSIREVAALPQSGADEPYVLAARAVRDARTGQPVVVVVGRSVAGLAETVGAVGQLMLVGMPVLVLVAAAVTYLFAGRALAPVEAIRLRVRDISSLGLAERVPVPVVRDEIGRLAETMNAMLAGLQTAHEAQQRFVADAGHELRSPLATIGVAIEVARRTASAASGLDRQLLDDLDAEVARMTRLVEDLLLLARADDHGLRLRREEVDLDDLVHAEARRLRAGSALGVVASVVPVRLLGDRDRLAQVLRNLTDNAQRHARSKVALSLRTDHGVARLRIDDDGEGVAPADRARVFDRFVRLDAARDRGSGGAGLGLSIVREIVIGHGGQVVIEDSPLGGVSAMVSLPVAAP